MQPASERQRAHRTLTPIAQLASPPSGSVQLSLLGGLCSKQRSLVGSRTSISATSARAVASCAASLSVELGRSWIAFLKRRGKRKRISICTGNYAASSATSCSCRKGCCAAIRALARSHLCSNLLSNNVAKESAAVVPPHTTIVDDIDAHSRYPRILLHSTFFT